MELEVLVAEVREDRGVVGDRRGRGPWRARARSSRGPPPGRRRRPSPAAPAGAPARRASSRARRRASRSPPTLRLDGPDEPGRAGRRPRAPPTARNEVVVLPSVPVMPTTPSSRLGSPYHHAGGLRRAPPGSVDDELAAARLSGTGALDEGGRRAADGRPRAKSWPSTCSPGDRDEQRPRAHAGASRRVEAPDLDAGRAPPARSPGRRRAPGRPRAAPSAARRAPPSGRGSRGSAAARSGVDRRHGRHASLDGPGRRSRRRPAAGRAAATASTSPGRPGSGRGG